MKLKHIDRIAAYIIIAGGMLQMIATPIFFNTPEEPAFWFFNGGFTLLLAGLSNIFRLRYSSELPPLRQLSVAVNIVLFALWLCMAYFLWYKFQRYPFALLPLFALGVASFLSVLHRHTPLKSH